MASSELSLPSRPCVVPRIFLRLALVACVALSAGVNLTMPVVAAAQVREAGRAGPGGDRLATRLAAPRPASARLAPAPRVFDSAREVRSTRRARRRRTRLALSVGAGVGFALSLGVAELSVRRHGDCAGQSEQACRRERRAVAVGSFAASSLVFTPLSIWAAGSLTGGRGGYAFPLLMTVVGTMVGGLVFAMVESLTLSPRRGAVGVGVAALMPAAFGLMGYLARDAERRRFHGGLAVAPTRGGATVGYVGRF